MTSVCNAGKGNPPNTVFELNLALVIYDTFSPFITNNDDWYGAILSDPSLNTNGNCAIKRMSSSNNGNNKTYIDNLGNVYQYSFVPAGMFSSAHKNLLINGYKYIWFDGYSNYGYAGQPPTPYKIANSWQINDFSYYVMCDEPCSTFTQNASGDLVCGKVDTEPNITDAVFFGQTSQNNNIWVWIAVILLVILLIYVIYRSQM